MRVTDSMETPLERVSDVLAAGCPPHSPRGPSRRCDRRPPSSRLSYTTESPLPLPILLTLLFLPFLLRMAPHRAILVHDILLEIFGHLSSSSPTASGDQRDRAALLSAALACRRFLDPALSLLWRSIDDFLPLLMLFSSFQAVTLPGFERRSSYSYHATSYVSSKFLDLPVRRNQGSCDCLGLCDVGQSLATAIMSLGWYGSCCMPRLH